MSLGSDFQEHLLLGFLTGGFMLSIPMIAAVGSSHLEKSGLKTTKPVHLQDPHCSPPNRRNSVMFSLMTGLIQSRQLLPKLPHLWVCVDGRVKYSCASLLWSLQLTHTICSSNSRDFTDFSKRGKKNQLFSLFVFTESIFIHCELIETQRLWLLVPAHQAVPLFQSAAIFVSFQVGTLIFSSSPCVDC